jgi:two-component system, NtrC family, nitrogen regulation response regulator NtrX
MSVGAQAKVLRALQSGEITRVGSERAIAVDVRVLAATNKDLESEVEKGAFRDDLYFRLNVVPIRSPALRDRREDIPLLAQAFLKHFCREYGGREKPADPEVFELLMQRPWPGNVRELRNVVERMVILSGPRLTVEDVPRDWIGHDAADDRARAGHAGTVTGEGFLIPLEPDEKLQLREFRDRAETAYVLATLRQCDWNISRAAGLLGIERTNLHKKMRSFGIRRDHATADESEGA